MARCPQGSAAWPDPVERVNTVARHHITTQRSLLVTADDFGIGPETSRGILDLAARGIVTSTVLLVTSPHAEDAVDAWHAAGQPLELGWHPCLTLDSPILPPAEVPSLVAPNGRFHGLGELLKRLVLGQVRTLEVEAELRAQYQRFLDLVGEPPGNVNAHHHTHVFRPIGDALRRVLRDVTPRVFVRRVVEPMTTLWKVPGARVKRAILTRLGRSAARRQATDGLPGCEAVLGITDPPCLRDGEFFTRWLATARGQVLELACHPGHLDASLIGRDGTLADGQIHRRVREFELLSRPTFLDAVRGAGFRLVTASGVANPSGWFAAAA